MTYKVQIDDKVRDATETEAAAIEASQNTPDPREKIEAAKTSARAKLKALGLTDAEIAALVG